MELEDVKIRSSCPHNSSETPLSSPPSDNPPMSVYQSVLQNKTQFFSIDTQKNLTITQLNQAVSNDNSVKVKVTKFTLADLEKDDIPEVILWLAANNSEDFGFEVLNYKNEMIYGYTLPFRSFMDLKDDGTFSFSSGAADYGFGTIEFTKNGYMINKISYSESNYDSNNNLIISYFVNHENTTKEDFLSTINKQNEKRGVTWYDFTDDNIERLLSSYK